MGKNYVFRVGCSNLDMMILKNITHRLSMKRILSNVGLKSEQRQIKNCNANMISLFCDACLTDLSNRWQA